MDLTATVDLEVEPWIDLSTGEMYANVTDQLNDSNFQESERIKLLGWFKKYLDEDPEKEWGFECEDDVSGWMRPLAAFLNDYADKFDAMKDKK